MSWSSFWIRCMRMRMGGWSLRIYMLALASESDDLFGVGFGRGLMW